MHRSYAGFGRGELSYRTWATEQAQRIDKCCASTHQTPECAQGTRHHTDRDINSSSLLSNRIRTRAGDIKILNNRTIEKGAATRHRRNEIRLKEAQRPHVTVANLTLLPAMGYRPSLRTAPPLRLARSCAFVAVSATNYTLPMHPQYISINSTLANVVEGGKTSFEGNNSSSICCSTFVVKIE